MTERWWRVDLRVQTATLPKGHTMDARNHTLRVAATMIDSCEVMSRVSDPESSKGLLIAASVVRSLVSDSGPNGGTHSESAMAIDAYAAASRKLHAAVELPVWEACGAVRGLTIAARMMDLCRDNAADTYPLTAS